jgi:hypothetical protein
MTVMDGPKSAGLVSRVQGILLKPSAEWDVIDGESATVPGLFTGYACILAAIGPIASVVGSFAFMHWTLPLIVISAVLSYVMSLVGVYIVGFIVDALAPSFDAQKNPIQAMKLAVYSFTPAWVAGVFHLVPFLGILILLAVLYNLYIFWLGIPKLMKAPADKATGYAVVSIVITVVVFVVIFWVEAAVVASMTVGAVLASGALVH